MLFLKCKRKKFRPIFKELLKFLPKKFSICSQIYGFGIQDPGSGKNLSRIPDAGVKKAPDPGSRIWIRNTGSMWLFVLYPRGREFSQSGISGATRRNGWVAGRLKTSISRPN
jgi:hypothetical protein